VNSHNPSATTPIKPAPSQPLCPQNSTIVGLKALQGFEAE
jgi:hypothetical protein